MDEENEEQTKPCYQCLFSAINNFFDSDKIQAIVGIIFEIQANTKLSTLIRSYLPSAINEIWTYFSNFWLQTLQWFGFYDLDVGFQFVMIDFVIPFFLSLLIIRIIVFDSLYYLYFFKQFWTLISLFFLTFGLSSLLSFDFSLNTVNGTISLGFLILGIILLFPGVLFFN